MGQRLNLEINNDCDCVANAYYHWGANTKDANELLLKIIEELENPNSQIKQIEAPVLKAIRLLEITGARLSDTELEAASKKFPNEQFDGEADRNEGFIAFTEEGMEEIREWMEGQAVIHITDENVSYDSFFTYNSIEDFGKDNGYDPTKVDVAAILLDKSDIDIDLSTYMFSFDEIKVLKKIYEELDETGDEGVFFKNGMVLTPIG